MPEKGADPEGPEAPAARAEARPRALEPAAAGRLPGADQPALVDARAARARSRAIEPETDDAATVRDPPGYEWEGHKPGQYLRIGLDIEGVRHWRAYSLTSDPDREDGFISITVKNVDEGTVSPYLVRRGRPGHDRRAWAAWRATSCCPTELPEKLLFISAGSGITPIMSMLRSLAAPGRARATSCCSTPRATRTT